MNEESFLFRFKLNQDCFFNFHRDEKVVSQAIELNEQLHQILARHDALLSGTPTSTANHVYHEGEEEEEAEQLFRRYVLAFQLWN